VAWIGVCCAEGLGGEGLAALRALGCLLKEHPRQDQDEPGHAGDDEKTYQENEQVRRERTKLLSHVDLCKVTCDEHPHANGREKDPYAQTRNAQYPEVDLIDSQLVYEGQENGNQDEHGRNALQNGPQEDETQIAEKEKDQGGVGDLRNRRSHHIRDLIR